VQGGAGKGAPSCVIVTVVPATVSVAVRGLVFGLAVAVNALIPDPVPLAPDAIVIHAAPLVAVHAHDPADAVTVI
jgi:hypothetical protein